MLSTLICFVMMWQAAVAFSTAGTGREWVRFAHCENRQSTNRKDFSDAEIIALANTATRVRFCQNDDNCATSKPDTFPIVMLREGRAVFSSDENGCDQTCTQENWIKEYSEGPEDNLWNCLGWHPTAALAGTQLLYRSGCNGNGLHFGLSDGSNCDFRGEPQAVNNLYLGVYAYLDVPLNECRNMPALDHGSFSKDNADWHGSKATYTCDPGFTRSGGPHEITCAAQSDDADWPTLHTSLTCTACPAGYTCDGSDTISAIPCTIANSDQVAGPDCACLPGYAGDPFNWEGQTRAGRCTEITGTPSVFGYDLEQRAECRTRVTESACINDDLKCSWNVFQQLCNEYNHQPVDYLQYCNQNCQQ